MGKAVERLKYQSVKFHDFFMKKILFSLVLLASSCAPQCNCGEDYERGYDDGWNQASLLYERRIGELLMASGKIDTVTPEAIQQTLSCDSI